MYLTRTRDRDMSFGHLVEKEAGSAFLLEVVVNVGVCLGGPTLAVEPGKRME